MLYFFNRPFTHPLQPGHPPPQQTGREDPQCALPGQETVSLSVYLLSLLITTANHSFLHPDPRLPSHSILVFSYLSITSLAGFEGCSCRYQGVLAGSPLPPSCSIHSHQGHFLTLPTSSSSITCPPWDANTPHQPLRGSSPPAFLLGAHLPDCQDVI